MSAETPPCQLLERQSETYRDWLWVAPPHDAWLNTVGGSVWSADAAICHAWRARGRPVHAELAPTLTAPVPGAVLFWPKTHALGEWWLLALCAALPEGTPLQVVGEHQGGVKRVLKSLAALGLGCRKVDNARRCTLYATRTAPLSLSPDAAWTTFEAAGLNVASHPGVFGHGKLDDGTRLLLETLPGALGDPAGRHLLDMGSGDGILAAWLGIRGASVSAVDSNAFAVAATRRTLEANRVAGNVWQSDVFGDVTGPFDAIVSNPPFHQERAVDYGPAARLIREAPDKLVRGGSLILVANAFLPYPRVLADTFGDVTTLADDRRFRVYRAIKR
ncbi:16S rRNA m(2)G 1207 methyltransferase [Chromohalobacter marismortui]|uniref:Ribosomal RNA small subunit methyltransferase C n=1 Tax=Chromohalobacter marismortui TaxID=42055 RepID=A0A4R7NJ14_9GAMM|nr:MULTISPECIES: class I SAM-dependent methyltransferase [Chromohalobacter]MCI0511531.1 class I SAM-dependent methyltransferase [Chromohalobacter sp.]MCI0594456.1 class I SAM-dependent methyltransferase [Chromohalobacter sp.]TDU20472.1 16S rRNA m(2)G 1207 methyltransferase [Chromohalobacter marismortui]